MYRLEHPEYFYLLAVLPVVWLMYAGVLWWKRKKQKQFADPELLDKLIPEKSRVKSFFKVLLWSLAFALLVTGMVNPKMGYALKTVKRSGVDLVFAIDVSKSMLCEDVAPSRLEKAKKIVRSIIERLGSDRVGIIIYAGSAYPILPMTTDHAAARLFLDNISTDMVSSQGTAIGQAVEIAADYFDDDEQAHRFLFIISDGEDHEQNLDAAIEKIKSKSVQIHTIGLGTVKGGPIPIKRSGSLHYKKDRNGNMVITSLHEDVLKRLAQATGGSYFPGNDVRQVVKDAGDVIIHADKKEYESKEFTDYKDQFQWFIFFGIMLLLLDVFILERKTRWIQALNLFNENE